MIEIEIEIKRLCNHHSEHSYRRELKIKDVIESIPATLASHTHKISNNIGDAKNNDPDYKFLDGKLGAFMILSKKGALFNELDLEYLKPLIDELLESHREKDYSEELLVACKKSRTMMEDLRRDTLQFLSDLEEIPVKFKSHIDQIQKMSNKIKLAIEAQ